MTVLRAALESELSSAYALALWQRISARIDDRLESVEQAVVLLLERSLRAEEVRVCIEDCGLIARWAFALDLAVAGRIAREIGEELGANTLTSREATGLATRIEDLRRVLRIAGDDWLDRLPGGGHVHVVSRIDARTDALMWHLRRNGLSVTSTTRFIGSPEQPDVMVLFWEGDCRDAVPALGEIARRSGDTGRVMIHGADAPASHLAEVAPNADLLLSIEGTAAELAHEVRAVAAPIADWTRRVVAYGAGDHRVELSEFGFESVVVDDIGSVMEKLTGNEQTLLIGDRVADPADLVALVRSTPATRTSVVAVVAPSSLIGSKCRQLGADLVIEPRSSVDTWGLHLRGLVSRRQTSRLMLEIEATELADWASTVVVFERALASLGRSAGRAALAVLTLPDDLTESQLVAVRTAFMQEFRTADLLGESEDGVLLVLLRGATREAAVNRIQIALENVEIPATPGRAGVAEFPIDGYSLGELMTSAVQAADRSVVAGGPVVVASGWFSEDAAQVDVVLVESDPTLASILVQLLDQIGLTSTHVLTGSDALRHLSGGSAVRLPRLIIIELDAMGADGLMVLRSLARHGVMTRTKVIVTCARIRDGELREAFELGVDDVVVKPFSAVVLSNRIRQVLNDR